MGEDLTRWARAVTGGLADGTLETASVAGQDVPRPVREVAERWYPIDSEHITTVRRGALDGRVFYVVGDGMLFGVYDDSGRRVLLPRRTTGQQAKGD
jgi:hypothetical protein